MARHKDIDPKELAKMLAEPPKPERDVSKLVEGLTGDKAKQAQILAEVAELDEIIRTLRADAARGMASAIGNILKAKKLRTEILRLRQPDSGDGGGHDEGTVDAPLWAPAVKSSAAAPAPLPPDNEDDVDLNTALEAELKTHA